MTPPDPKTPTLSEEERAEIAALAAAAQQLASRRKFLRAGAVAVVWAAPIVETLTVVPEAEAQGMGMGMMMTMGPMMIMGMP